MSRLGLNRSTAMPDDDFQFGELPEDESEVGSEYGGDEIDAVNDETFGADVGSLVIDDLEQYSKQTEVLQLSDSPREGWSADEPSCSQNLPCKTQISVSAPDPSQIPLPNFDNNISYADNNNINSLYNPNNQYNMNNTNSIYTTNNMNNSPNVTGGLEMGREATTSSSYQLNLGTLESLWLNNPPSAAPQNASLWNSSSTAAPQQLTSSITQAAIEFINNNNNNIRNINKQQQQQQQNVWATASASTQKPKSVLAAIPKNALTLEEIERSQLASSSVRQPPTTEHKPPQPMPIPSEGAMTVADFEQQMLMELASKQRNTPTPMYPYNNNNNADTTGKSDEGAVNNQLRNCQENNNMNSILNNTSNMNTISNQLMNNPTLSQQQLLSGTGPQQPAGGNFQFPPFPPFMPPFMAQTLRAHLNGQLRELPPNFAAQIRAFSQMPAPQSFGQPPPLMPPPHYAQMQRGEPQIIRPNMPTQLSTSMPSQRYYTNNYNNNINNNAVGSFNRVYNNSNVKRSSKNLPSGKTISDFAFDPYAGFMSKKEREWLIKIQTLQCQGQSGNPFEDDYYYAVWRKKHHRANKTEKDAACLQESEKKTEKDSTTTTTNSSNTNPSTPHHYIPPTFEGSLGKPTLSSAYYPRQLIDVHSENAEEDERQSQLKNSSVQKKLKALLMQLECVASLHLEVEERFRSLNSIVDICNDIELKEQTAQLQEEIEKRLEMISEYMKANLRIVLIINKGRGLFARTLKNIHVYYSDYCNKYSSCNGNTNKYNNNNIGNTACQAKLLVLLESFVNVMPVITQKVAQEQLNTSLSNALFETFSLLSFDNLIKLIRILPINELFDAKNICKNTFLVNLLMGLLISFARQVNWSQLDDLVMIGIPLFEWFKSTSAHCPMDSDYNTYYNNNNNNNGKNGNNENKKDQHDSECVEQQDGVLSITAEDLKCLKNWLKENFDKYTEKAVAMRIREFL